MVLVTTAEHEFYEKFPILSKQNTFPGPIVFDIVYDIWEKKLKSIQVIQQS